MRFLSLQLFLFLLYSNFFPQVRTDYLTIDQGLSQNYVFSVCQDTKGFLWIGTKDGLNRFDGSRFICFRHDPLDSGSLSGNNISAIYEDSKQKLWIGTNGGGLNLFNRTSGKFRNIVVGNDSTSLSSNFISCIYESSDGFVWIGTNDGGLNKLNPANGFIEQFRHNKNDSSSISSNFISGISEGDNNILWIATANGGLNKYNPGTNKFTHLLPNDMEGKDLNFKNNATSVLADKKGMVWFGTASGLNHYNPMNGTLKRFHIYDSNGNPCLINNILEKDRKLYLTSFNTIVVFDKKTEKYSILAEAPQKWFTHAVCFDKSGILWIGTGGWGIAKLNLSPNRFVSKKGSFLPEAFPKVVSVLKKKFSSISDELLKGRGTEFLPVKQTTKGEFLVATPNMGLIKIDGSGKTFQIINTNPMNVLPKPVWAVSDVFEDKEKNIWIATIGGISQYDSMQKAFIHYRLYDNKTITPQYLNKSGAEGYSDITAVYVDEQNIFWLGTPDRGLIRFDCKRDSVSFFSQKNGDKNSIGNNHILSIAEDKSGSGKYLWIGTDGGGLARFEKATGNCERYTCEDGLPNNVIYGILHDKNGNLWLSTNKGICCFNPNQETLKNYDVEYGLQSNEFNRKEYYRSPDGKLYFGGIEGYNAFYPEDIKTNTNEPKIVFTGFKLFNKEVSYTDTKSPLITSIEETNEIILDYSQNVITFEFAALEFTIPQLNTYKYFLEGFNSGWANSGTSREATFTNLDPGEYKFRVKGANNDGIWGTDEASIKLVILPPFYMTWWFKVSVILIIIIITGFVVRYVIRRRVRETIIKAEHKAAMERERLRIARDLHDEIGSRLTELRMISEMVADKETFDSEVKFKLKELSNASENVISTFSEIVWSLNPKNDSLEEFMEFLCQKSAEFLNKADIRCRLELPQSLPNYIVNSEMSHNLLSSVKEIVNNIVKHSNASIVHISLELNELEMVITITDNGIGFNIQNIRKYGNGLDNIKARISNVGCSVLFDSKIDNGTTVKITIPVASIQDK